MQIQEKKFTTTVTAISVKISFPGFKVGDTEVTGRMEFYDSQNQLVQTIEQPIDASLISDNPDLNAITDWLLQQNGITLAS